MKKQILSTLLSCAVAVSCCSGVMAAYKEVGTSGASYNGSSYVKDQMWADNLDSYTDTTALDAAWNGSIAYLTVKDGAVTLAPSSTSNKDQTEFYKDVQVDCTKAPIVVTQEVTFSDNTSSRLLMYLWNWRNDGIPSTAIEGLWASEDGYFKIGADAVMPYSAGTYTVQTVVDTTADTAEYIVNGTSVGVAAIPETFEKIVRYTPIKQCGSEGQGTVTVDNMVIHKLTSGIGHDTNLITRGGKNYSVNTLLTDDFTTLDTSVWLGGMTSVTADEAHGNAIQLTYAGSDVEVYRNLSGSLMSDANGVYMFRADYKFSDTTSSRFLMEARNSGVYIKSDWGNIKDVNGAGIKASTTDWFTLTEILDLKNDVFEYYINDLLVWSGSIASDYSQVARITLGKQRGGNGNNQSVMIDNFGMYKLNEHYTGTQVTYNGVKYDGLEIHSDNFDAYTGKAGEAGPSGWAASADINKEYVESAQYDSLHGNSVAFTKVSADAQLYHDYSGSLFGDNEALYLISADYLFTKSGQRRLMIIKDNTYGDLQLFRAENNGQFKSCDNSPVAASYGAYEFNRWYRIQMLVDVKNQKYSIYIDGNPVAENLQLPKTIINLNRIVVAKERGTSGMLVDNYSLTKLYPAEKLIKVKAYGNDLTALSTLLDGDEVTVEATFDTTDSDVIIAIYNADGTLAQVEKAASMTLADFPAENSYLKAFVFNAETQAPECDEATVNY